MNTSPRLLKSNDHGAWRILCSMLANGSSFETIATYIGCDVEHLIDWANHIYVAEKCKSAIDDLPKGSPVRRRLEANARIRQGVGEARRLAAR